jgi:hypothetical protein
MGMKAAIKFSPVNCKAYRTSFFVYSIFETGICSNRFAEGLKKIAQPGRITLTQT